MPEQSTHLICGTYQGKHNGTIVLTYMNDVPGSSSENKFRTKHWLQWAPEG